jgi:general secretion pathway protein G
LLRPYAADSAKVYGEALTQQRLVAVADALDGFKKDMGRYPTAAEGLGALIKEPPAGGKWLGPYIPTAYVTKGAVVDAAGKPFGYRLEGDTHTVIAPGKDGLLGSADDARLVLENRKKEKPLGSGFEGLFGGRNKVK